MKLVSSVTMRLIDREAIDNRGIPSLELMENAGRGIALRLLTDHIADPENTSVAIFCGKGNNGGDGYVIARHLVQAGVRITIYYLGLREKMSDDARHNFDAAAKLDIEMVELADIDKLPGVLEADLVVDAVFGTGFEGTPRGLSGEMIDYINSQGCVTVAVDMPSGLNADTGLFEGSVVEADYTYTLAQPKYGLFLSPGREVCGDIEVVPIGIPDEVVDSFALKIDLLDIDWVAAKLPVRRTDGHKGIFGRVLTVAGSTGMTGAAALAAMASLRSGCGLAKVACPKSVQPVLAGKLTEAITHSVPDVARKGALALRGLGELRALTKETDAVVLGPGIGRHHETMELMRRLLKTLDKPTVIDADGLNAFEGKTDLLTACTAPLVLTPHPGEFFRLSGSTAPQEMDIEARAEAAGNFAAQSGAIVVLKGSPTLIAAPDGRVFLNPTGNHGMATGGSGDVLSGIIGTLLAQMDDAFEAASVGVFIHGLAGDLAAEALTPRAMIAGDLIDYLPEVFQLLE